MPYVPHAPHVPPSEEVSPVRTHRRPAAGGERDEARPAAAGAQRRTADPRTPDLVRGDARAMPALQGSVGNGTVLRMLHRSGHPVLQRTHFGPGEEVTADPGYSVTLNATVNGVGIGTFSSQTTPYSPGDHAEDQLIDELETACSMPTMARADTAQALAQGQPDGQGGRLHTLVISDLTASPCSSRHGTTTKAPGVEGCTERLVDLATNGHHGHRFQITIRAHHLYQPRIPNARALSQQAVADLTAAGITIQVG